MGRFNVDRYEATFVTERTPEEVWASLGVEGNGQPAWLTAWPRMPGFETTGEVIASETGRHLRVHKHSEPCKDSEIGITLRAVDGGTHILVEQSNLPEWVASAVDVFVRGGDQITADFVLYIERGVQISRHSLPWAFSGILAEDAPLGLAVTGIVPGCFGERAGLEKGDILLTLGGAPLFTRNCLETAMRLLSSGTEIECSWVRGSDILEARAEL